MKLPFFKKADIILLAVLLVLGAGSLLLLKGGEQGSVAVISVDGEAVERIELTQEYQETTVETHPGREPQIRAGFQEG